MRVLGAFLGARFADIRAESTHGGGLLTVAGQVCRGETTQRGAIEVERDASNHRSNVAVVQALGGAVVAGASTGVAGFDAGSEFSVHGSSS